MTIDLAVILNGLILAAICWFGKKAVAVCETVVRHDEHIKNHGERIVELERCPPCPNVQPNARTEHGQ